MLRRDAMSTSGSQYRPAMSNLPVTVENVKPMISARMFNGFRVRLGESTAFLAVIVTGMTTS